MGIVNITPPDISSAVTKAAVLFSADGGVDYSFDGMLISDDKAAEIKNMWLQNGILTSRTDVNTVAASHFDSTSVHSLKDFGGCAVMHIGSTVYKISGDSAEPILEGLSDKKSIPVEFSGKLYIYCDSRVYSVTRDFDVKEEMPYAPLYSVYSSTNDLYPEKEAGFKANILAPYIAVRYEAVSGINDSTEFRVNELWDGTKMSEIYINGEKNDECVPVVSKAGKSFRLTGVDLSDAETVEVHFCSMDVKFDYTDRLSGCTVGAAFGGGTLDGTRVILAGNSAYPGKFFSSELANALYFTEDSGGEVGGCNEDITAFSMQDGYLMIFTDNTVSRMSYSYTEEYGGYYSIKTVSTDTGCDAPESVALIDNKTVFVSSSKGVYIIDTNEIYDSLNIVPISVNITDETGAKGWFSLSEEARRGAECCVCDRKYILTAGERSFIWDFGSGVYVSSSDHIKAARNLKWFEFTTDGCMRIISAKRKLFALIPDGAGGCGLYGLDGEETGIVNAVYKSKTMDFDYPHMRKNVRSFKCGCRTERAAEMVLEFYADGVLYRTAKVWAEPDKDGYASICVKLPAYSLMHFTYVMRISTPDVGIFNTSIEYTVLKSNMKE